ncbi:MAG: MarR family transcriptional regulator [Alcaligenaceae bacterium]|nr:MarR family transcriptional regulator [Alcaligenaceae bacterium SAGV5]MPS52236.1 MarR family transcriptional regulator [Alcaligenaceae bacterium SAGV3]MPT58009.1 MarR family transcriptional regulator [Alcaligenaceae bacterium]
MNRRVEPAGARLVIEFDATEPASRVRPLPPASPTTPRRDSVQQLLDDWKRERPDLDPWPLGIIGRLSRLSTHMVRHAEEWLAPMGLTWETFSLIVTLRRCGPEFALKPSDLIKVSLLTSGAVTNRIDRVQARGLVVREPDPNDRRGVIVRLTPEGKALADEAIARHFDAMAGLLRPLGRQEADKLAAMLSTLLFAIEARD